MRHIWTYNNTNMSGTRQTLARIDHVYHGQTKTFHMPKHMPQGVTLPLHCAVSMCLFYFWPHKDVMSWEASWIITVWVRPRARQEPRAATHWCIEVTYFPYALLCAIHNSMSKAHLEFGPMTLDSIDILVWLWWSPWGYDWRISGFRWERHKTA